ncbi:sugar ABC transporter permease [Actinomyces sp.]|uniref:carbohydrate ABC transporter permease n=1 Tax=Actinomyces sp. TaxID=29317 RepID=UPI002907CA39|nr:sugar ABC transporter permease [Actinomyces sp.]MDU5569387.1 sugar ABC transporter permease [Actinomyces sp.]
MAVLVARNEQVAEKRRKSVSKSGLLSHYLLLMPAFLLSAAIVLIPAIFTFVIAFTDWDGVATTVNFVGTENFREIFADGVFLTALFNNVKWTILFLTIPVAIGLMVAVLLLNRPRSRIVFQTLFLLPYVMAAAVNAIIWLNMIYSPISGIVGVLNRAGIDIANPLTDTSSALYAVAAVDIWHYWGYLLIIYLAALRQVPYEQVEAARLDGANSFHIFRYVYLPGIASALKMSLIMIVIFSFLTFDYVYLMTQGGPANSTEILATYAYGFAFSTFQFGKAAAVGLIMSGFGLIASIVYVRVTKRKD